MDMVCLDFIATDNGSKRGFFTDYSGSITSINLDDCTVNWTVYLKDVLDFPYYDNFTISSRNGVALYKDSYGNEGVLIGGPNFGDLVEYCYILSLKQSDGSLLWKVTSITADGYPLTPTCQNHGFIVDGKYGYGVPSY